MGRVEVEGTWHDGVLGSVFCERVKKISREVAVVVWYYSSHPNNREMIMATYHIVCRIISLH